MATELPEALGKARSAAEEVERLNGELQEARTKLRECVREAHDSGATAALIGRVTGLSRPAVSRLLGDGRNGEDGD